MLQCDLELSTVRAPCWILNRQKCREIFLRRISAKGENLHCTTYEFQEKQYEIF